MFLSLDGRTLHEFNPNGWGGNEMERILSFIVPAYNVAWCLEKAVDSILCEACMDEIEILIINDGSTDTTAEIAEHYVARFPRTVRLINKENGGHGSAVNTGACLARGKYFKVIDADDWIVTENLPRFIDCLKTCEADVVLTPYHRVDMSDGSRQIWKMYCEEYERSYSLQEIVGSWKKFTRCCMFHGITYRTDFYRHQNHQLPEKIFYEDHEYSAVSFCHAESVYPVNLYIYQYMVGNGEQSISDKNRLKRLSHFEQVTKDLLLYLREHGDLPEAGREYLKLKIASAVPNYYEIACIIQPDKKQGRKDMKQFNRMLRQYAPDIYGWVRKKSCIFMLLGFFRMPAGLYHKRYAFKLYSCLRKAYALEEESN